MRLKKLTIHNLASIEDAVIDFENGPLAEDSRFLICGPTGSGKTTLLDAICLVLYGTTPRLKAAYNETYVDTDEKFTLKQRDDIKIDDTRMLMRRGAHDALVELVYTDKDEKLFKASWHCSRARNNPQGSIMEPVWTLTDADDNVIPGKKRETLNIIEEGIGLTFEQFCRTTMLAQGDFTRFLKSKDSEKSEILEKLTGTDIYSEISKRIHIITGEKEKICADIKARLEGVRLLSDDERNEIIQKQTELKAKAELLAAEEQKLTAVKSWMEQLQQAEQQYAQVSRDYDEQHGMTETDEYKRNSKMADDWQRTAPQRDEWNRRASAQKLIGQYRQKESELKSRYEYLCAGLLSMHLEEKRCADKKKETDSFIKAGEPNAESYRQINLIQSLVQQHKQNCMQIKKSEESIASKSREADELNELQKQQTGKVGKCTADAEAVTEELNTLARELQKMDYNGLLSQQKDKIKEITSLNEYSALVESYIRCHDALQQKTGELNALRKDIETYRDDVEKAGKEVAVLEEQTDMQQKIYDKLEKSCRKVIQEYRSQLQEGDICPLCGQKIHEIVSDEHFVSVLQPVKESLEQLKNKLTEAGKALSDRKAVLSQALNNEKLRLDELSKAEAKEKESITRRQQHVMYSEYESFENPTDEINKRKAGADKSLKQIEEQLKAVGILQARVSAVQKEKENIEKVLHKEEAALKDMEKKHAVALNFILSENKNIESLRQSVTETEQHMSHYISLESYKKDGDKYILSVRTAAADYQKALERQQNEDLCLQRISSDLKHIGCMKSMIDGRHEDWAAIEVSEPEAVNDLSSSWVKLQADVMGNAEALGQSEKAFSEADKILHDYFSEDGALSEPVMETLALMPSADIERVRVRLQEIRDKELSMKAKKNTIGQNIKTLHDNRPQIEEGASLDTVAARLLNSKSEINDANQQLGQFNEILNNDEANKKRFADITRQLDEAGRVLDQWNKLNELFGSHDGKKFRNIAQSYVLEQLLVNANQYLLQFTDRYEMICQPGSLTILLRDNEAGGVIRPTTTISGGESFLISLSLALGLSSLSRASFSVDTLFIDEGFGTLDSTYLSCVMDALERLHQMGGKKIGIISHVESLKERLTTQIQVSRVNNTLSRVDVVSTI